MYFVFVIRNVNDILITSKQFHSNILLLSHVSTRKMSKKVSTNIMLITS